jgi:hypothetical protein
MGDCMGHIYRAALHFWPIRFSKIAKKLFIEHYFELGITILNLRKRRSCQGNQKVTRFHISMMLETAKMVLPEHQLPYSPTKSKFPAKLLEL